MPSLDMPLGSLKAYKGISPRPEDFDEYWERALKELEKTQGDVEIVPTEFQVPYAKCYDLIFRGVGGKRIYAKLVTPKDIKEEIPAIVEFHGYGGYSKDWTTKLHYAAAGIAVFSMDCRDQLGNTGADNFRRGNLIRGLSEGVDKLYYRSVFLDAVKLVHIAMSMEFIDEERVATLGISQGGALALAASALEPRVCKIFSVYPFLCDYKRVWEMDLGESPYEELRDYFRFKDPLHEREEEIFTKLGYVDVQYLAPRIRGDVTVVTGLMDRICPPSTQFAMYNRLETEKKMLIYPDFGHEEIFGLNDKVFQWALTI